MPGPLRRLVPAALALGLPVLAAAQPIAIVGGEVHTGAGEVLAGATSSRTGRSPPSARESSFPRAPR